MTEERIIEFACPLKIKLVIPRDCVIDERMLKERVDAFGPELFKELCDACPLYLAKGRN